VDRLYQIMDLEPERLGEGQRAPFRGVKGALELQGVTFRYGCLGNVLEGGDLRIPAGKTVAVVGESGSGQSAPVERPVGLDVPTEGRVCIDGVDLRDLDLASLRRGVGVVSQSPFLFSGTLRDNIALGRPQATLDEVIEAARAAGLEEYIAGLPDRYDTQIAE